MTEKLKKQLVFGILALGLFAFGANSANAQIVTLGVTKGLSEVAETQIIRAGGQDAVDKAAERAGYKSENIKAVSFSEAGDLLKKGSGVNNVTGAYSAAKARMSGSSNVFSGAWNVVSGAAKDLFRSSDEIAEDLQKYKTDENAADIENAIATAKEVQGSGSNILTGNIKSIPEKLEQLDAAANAVAVYQTADGQKIYMDENMKSLNGLMKGCVPIPLKLEQSRKCILCPLFVILFNTAQTMGYVSYDALAGGFKNLLLIGFALYVAYVTLKQVSSFTKQDGPKYLTDLLTMAFKVLLAYLILTNVQQLYTYLLEPMLSAAMDFGGAFLFRSASSHSDNSFMACTAASQLGDGATVVTGYFSTALFAKIDCFVRSIQQELAVATSIGSSLMCVAHSEAAHWYGLPDMTMLFSGLIIWVFSWLVCLAFGFYLIDSVVRLGVIGGLMPFLIAAWPFKLTSGYTKKGWDMFMNAFFTFVFLGLVVSVNIELGLQAITGGEGGYDKIMELVNANEIKPLVDIMSIGMMGLLFLILCCIFGFKLCGEAVSLASQMGGGSGGTIGANIASLGAGVAKWGAVKTAKASGKAISKTANVVGETTGINDAARGIRENVDRKISNAGARVGRFLHLKGVGPAKGGAGSTPVRAENNERGGDPAATDPTRTRNEQNGTNPEADESTAENRSRQNNVQNDENARNSRNRALGGAFADDDRDGAPASAENTHQAPNSDQTADTNGSETQPTDGGAGNAEPRNTENGADAANDEGNGNSRAHADTVVSDAKQKIAEAAQTAAEGKGRTATTESSRPVESSKQNSHDKKKDDKKNAAELKRMKAQIEELKKQVSVLEIEKDRLEKNLKSQSGGMSATTSPADAEQLKKVTEEKEKLESRLNSLLNSMKDQQ